MDGVRKTGRGGARAGAGRKKMDAGAKRRVVHVGLRPDVADWLEENHGRKKGEYVEGLIRASWDQ